jgi:hypothetical protein
LSAEWAEAKSFAVIASLVRSSGQQRKLWGLSPWSRVEGWRDPSLSRAGQGEVRLRLGQMAVSSLTGIELVDGDLAAALALVTGTVALANWTLSSHRLSGRASSSFGRSSLMV